MGGAVGRFCRRLLRGVSLAESDRLHPPGQGSDPLLRFAHGDSVVRMERDR
jgi:hypothetical protein